MSKLTVIWIALVIAGLLWLPGFLSQRINNKKYREDHRISATGIWSYLLGVRPGQEEVYLRPASTQLLGLLVLVFGFLSVWFCNDTRTLLKVISWGITGVGLVVCSLVWIIVDVVSKFGQSK